MTVRLGFNTNIRIRGSKIRFHDVNIRFHDVNIISVFWGIIVLQLRDYH